MRAVWQSEMGRDGIAVIQINRPDKSHNIVTAALLDSLDAAFKSLAKEPHLRGVIISSDKPGSFIAGADMRMLLACKSRSEAVALARRGQAFCNRIADFPLPVVAAIHGACLGVGLELALACRGRVASNDARTVLGLPEIKLGLLPSCGGTQRLPALLGLLPAFDILLTGRPLLTSQALAMGLVDEVVPASVLLTAARRRIEDLLAAPNMVVRPPLLQRVLENNPISQQLIFNRVRQRLRRPPWQNRAAPTAIVDCVEYGVRKPAVISLEYEAERFGELWKTRQARALIGLHFAMNTPRQPLYRVTPPKIEALAILGAGQMGSGIAALSTQAGLRVRLKDVSADALVCSLRHIDQRIDKAVARQQITAFTAQLQRLRVSPTMDYCGLRGYPLVIEAASEDLALKQHLLSEVEHYGRDNVIFASNTSCLTITAIAEAAQRPQNVIGMHYFAPAEKMPLLEVVVTEYTAPSVIATAVAVGEQQGKKVVVVHDGPGFYSNRILAPYLNEVGHLLLEGIPVDNIDAALLRFGFPMGPLALLDMIGFEVAAKVSATLHQAFGERMQPPALLPRLLDSGRQGYKNQRGFYRYRQLHEWQFKRSVDSRIYKELGIGRGAVMSADDIAERCVLPMVNEAVRCLDEGIIRSERDGNLAAVLGFGFPAFRGGPFSYLNQIGASTVAKYLHRLARRYGARFEPAPGLTRRG